ncbi:MAG TPA: putative peptidoglycan glycosyltransferase FtsW [Gemmatimonadaceae bacterium]|nr:putative peptidoglycan glycosyltransferase FtsW [Gemmatimonadaceae bacterium]
MATAARTDLSDAWTTAPRRVAHERWRWRLGWEARALVLVTAVLIVGGLAVLYSASAIVAMQPPYDGGAYFFLRQLVGVAAGTVVFAIAAKVDADRWRRLAWPIMGTTLLLMLIVVLPFTESIAPRINGSRRFLFGSSFQPSEIAKLAVVLWTAMLVVKKGPAVRRLTKGVLPFIAVVGTLNVLALLEPDLSAAMMYTLMMALILFAGGARIGHFVLLGAIAVPVLWNEVQRLHYAVLRMVSFLDPGASPEVVGYQLKQSLIAVGSGQLFGVGFGQGRQQNGFLPFPYNDFVASNIGEEWGFLGMLLLVLAFACYGWLGFRIAHQARSPFLTLTAMGLTITTVLTAYLHIGVVIGLLPTTGLTLPFISFGRSNLVLSLLMTGILVNIGSVRERVVGERASDPVSIGGR